MAFANAHGEFGLTLSLSVSEFSGRENNLVFSPFSVITALDMVYSGSAGVTAKEIASLFGYSESPQEFVQKYAEYLAELEKLLSSVTFRTAQGLMISNKEFISDQYVEAMTKSFSSEVFYGNIGNAVELVNKWVANKTNDKITQLLSQVPGNLAMIILNAIYFKGDWNDAFDEKLTQPRDFTLLSGETIKVPMMAKQFKGMNVFEGTTRSMIMLPYVGREIGLVIALPNNKMKDAEDKAKVVADISEGMKRVFIPGGSTVNVKLPKFKLEYTIDTFVEYFKRLGLSTLFDSSNCDLTPMSGRKIGDIFVSGIVHKAVLEVNEKGSEGAAATAVMISRMCMPMNLPKIIEFTVDRPFEFYIVTRKTRSILFSGRVMNPL